MPRRDFREMIEIKWSEGKFVCVGLDVDLKKISEIPGVDKKVGICTLITSFNRSVINMTRDLVCAYKPNFAFYLRHGSDGLDALKATVLYIKHTAQGVPVIIDCKVADIGNTNLGYDEYFFDDLGADAITVNPYLGGEVIQPFSNRRDKGIFVLCITSNPGAGEFQDLLTGPETSFGPTERIYAVVANNAVQKWNGNHNWGLVVGTTNLLKLHHVRQIAGDLPILITGIGAQGGDLEATIKAGQDRHGRGMIINSSRRIIFSEDPRQATIELHEAISKCLETEKEPTQ